MAAGHAKIERDGLAGPVRFNNILQRPDSPFVGRHNTNCWCVCVSIFNLRVRVRRCYVGWFPVTSSLKAISEEAEISSLGHRLSDLALRSFSSGHPRSHRQACTDQDLSIFRGIYWTLGNYLCDSAMHGIMICCFR